MKLSSNVLLSLSFKTNANASDTRTKMVGYKTITIDAMKILVAEDNSGPLMFLNTVYRTDNIK